MSAIGRVFGSLFGGGGKTVKSFAAPPPAPNIGDAGGEAAARLARSRLARRKGLEDTILTGGLGNVGTRTTATARPKSTLLG